MKNLFLLIPNLVKSGFKLWETSKEWGAKKRIIIFTFVPIVLILFTIVVKVFGVENAQMAAQILTELLNELEGLL